MVTQCCICHKIRQDETWIPAATHDNTASHTYCPECVESVWADIRAFKRACRAPSEGSTFRFRCYEENPRPLARLGDPG